MYLTLVKLCIPFVLYSFKSSMVIANITNKFQIREVLRMQM